MFYQSQGDVLEFKLEVAFSVALFRFLKVLFEGAFEGISEGVEQTLLRVKHEENVSSVEEHALKK